MSEESVVPIDDVSLADKKVQTSQFERYAGRKGQVDRIGILSTNLARTYRYFYDGGGRKMSFRAPKSEETLALCRQHLGEPEQRFGMILFHYRTDLEGVLLDTEKCQGRPKLWAISEARYEELSNIHRQWPLLDAGWGETQHDLLIRCSEEKYQRMTFTPVPEAHWKKKEAWFNALKKQELRAADRLKLALGRPMSDKEIMELFSASSAAPTGDSAHSGDLDLGDVLDD